MTAKMSSRERVLCAAAHSIPDRMPLDIQTTGEAWAKLVDHYGTDDNEAVFERLGIDIRYIGPVSRQKQAMYTDGTYDGPWGNRLRTVSHGTGAYEEVAFYPLDNTSTPEEITAFSFPDPAVRFDYSSIADMCHGYDAYALIGGYASVFYVPTQVRSMEKILLDMLLNQPMVDTLVEKALKHAIAYNEPLLAMGKGRIDFLHMADDFATQRGLLFSLDMWRRFFRKPMQVLVDMAHSYGARVMFHCCGAAAELIPDLIEMGIELLDPVQTSAYGMDPSVLKTAYGEKIAFHGGIDTQQTLPFGTPEQVKREVRERIEVLGCGGGYILSPCHAVQSDVPLANILAVFEAALG